MYVRRDPAGAPRDPALKSKAAVKIALRRGSLLVGTGIPFEGELLVSYTIIVLVGALQLVSPAAPTALTCTM